MGQSALSREGKVIFAVEERSSLVNKIRHEHTPPFYSAVMKAHSEIQIAMAKIGLANGPQYAALKFAAATFLFT